jgi:predicted transcriptional regulator
VSTVKTRNVTLSLPDSLIRRFKIFAAAKEQSMSSLMTEAIRSMVDQDEEYSKAKHRFLERIRNASDLGTHGIVTWTRDEIHER